MQGDFIIQWVPVMLQFKDCVSCTFIEKNGLVAFCTGINARLRYLSINSVKRVVPDRNVLLKGICWTMPSMPWWVLKFAGERPKARGNKGDWKREKKRGIPPRRLLSNSFFHKFIFHPSSIYEQKKKKTRQRGGRKDWQIHGATGWYRNTAHNRGNGRYIYSKTITVRRKETSRENIRLAWGKEAEGGRRGEKNRRWRNNFIFVVRMIPIPHFDPLVLCEMQWLRICHSMHKPGLTSHFSFITSS